MKFFTPNFLRNVLLYKGDATKALLMQKKYWFITLQSYIL